MTRRRRFWYRALYRKAAWEIRHGISPFRPGGRFDNAPAMHASIELLGSAVFPEPGFYRLGTSVPLGSRRV